MQVTTLSPPAIVGDTALWWFLWQGTADWPVERAQKVFYFLLAWMTFSKFVKLITHFVRYPVDIFLWPVSILFGWFHGAIKYYALATLSEVSSESDSNLNGFLTCSQTTWGSRAGADADDKDRMIKQKRPQFPEYYDEKLSEKLPFHEAMKTSHIYDTKRSPAVAA